MNERGTGRPENQADLRVRAERIVDRRIVAQRDSGERSLSVEQLEQFMHELEVHQVELEMQNEELRSAQVEVEYSRNRYADLYDVAPVGYVTIDESGVMRELNLTAAEMLGVERGRLLGLPLLTYADFDSKNRLVEHLRRCRAAEEGEELVAEVTLRVSSRGGLPVQIRSLAVREPQRGERQYRTALIDLSELRRSEEALWTNEEMLTLAVEAAEAGTWQIDLDTGQLVASERALAMAGLPAGTRLAKERALAAVYSDDRPRVSAAMHQAIQHGSDFRVECRVVLPDNSVRWLTCQGKRRETRHGRWLLGLVQDVTQRKQVEADLQVLNERLEQRVAQRTAEAERRTVQLRRLAGELSDAEHRERKRLAKLLHDHLQQLLVAARMRLSALRESAEHPLGEHADQPLVQDVDKLDGMLQDCIATSRDLTIELSPPILQRGKLGEAFTWLGGWLHQRHGLDVHVDMQDDPPHLPEPLRNFLFQAVRELMFNVVKHSGAKAARIVLTGVDGALVVEVEDAGEHFDPQAVQQKLERAQSLGLFQIRERLDVLGGRMEMQRAPGGGAHFRLILPAAALPAVRLIGLPAPPEQVGRSSADEPRSASAPIRVLVVDDHKIVREGFVALLNRQPDLQVVGEASHGKEAIELSRTLHPDVIIMDVNMPVLDGVEATEQIVRQQPGICIIGLSLDQEESVAREMLDAGAVGYVCKDAPTDALFHAVREAVGR